MSKGCLSNLARSPLNLEIPATETRAKTVHHSLSAVTIAQLELVHPVVQGLSADRTQLSIRPSETKNKGVTENADSLQDLERLHRKRDVVVVPGLHAQPRDAPHGLVEGDLRPESTRRLREASSRQNEKNKNVLDNLGRRRRPQCLEC